MGTSITQDQNTSAAEACLEAINARFEGTGVSALNRAPQQR